KESLRESLQSRENLVTRRPSSISLALDPNLDVGGVVEEDLEEDNEEGRGLTPHLEDHSRDLDDLTDASGVASESYLVYSPVSGHHVRDKPGGYIGDDELGIHSQVDNVGLTVEPRHPVEEDERHGVGQGRGAPVGLVVSTRGSMGMGMRSFSGAGAQ
ncbi:unnamed protein product, partial [Discosporangium mesarthrocarpum]